jgi:hypothetical protein
VLSTPFTTVRRRLFSVFCGENKVGARSGGGGRERQGQVFSMSGSVHIQFCFEPQSGYFLLGGHGFFGPRKLF